MGIVPHIGEHIVSRSMLHVEDLELDFDTVAEL